MVNIAKYRENVTAQLIKYFLENNFIILPNANTLADSPHFIYNHRMSFAVEEIAEVQNIVELALKDHSHKFFPVFHRDDRELLDRMVRVEEELKHLREDMQHSREDSNRRFAEMFKYTDKRFEEMQANMNLRFSEMQASMNLRFEEVREDSNKRFSGAGSRF